MISTAAENKRALEVVEKLMDCKDRNPEQNALLDLAEFFGVSSKLFI